MADDNRSPLGQEELTLHLRYMRAVFATGFWEPISPHINALCDAVEGFDARLRLLEAEGQASNASGSPNTDLENAGCGGLK